MKNSQTPMSDKLLASIEEEEAAAAQGQVDTQKLSQLMQTVQQQNPSSAQGLANVRGLFNGSLTA